MESRLLVFVSSRMSELHVERQVVAKAVAAIPVTRPWVFEHTPASSETLPESYLQKVKECDIFIMLLGEDISKPIIDEYRTAVEYDKPRLVFLKDVGAKPEAKAFIKEIDVKWRKFSATDELEQLVQEAVADELIIGYRRYRLIASEFHSLVDFMEQIGVIAVLDGDHIQATVTDVQGPVAVGKGIIQTRDISADDSAVAVGVRPVATVVKRYLADIERPLNAVLTACLSTVLIGEMLSFFAMNWDPKEIYWTGCFLLPLMICVPSYAVPVGIFGLVLSIPLRSRRNMVLSISVGIVGIALAVLARIVIEVAGKIYGG